MKYLDSEKDLQLESLLKENEALREELEEQKKLVKRLEEEVVKYLYEKIECRSELELMRGKGGPGKVRSKSPDKTPRQLKGEKKAKIEKKCLRCSVKILSPKAGKKFCKKCSALLSKEGRDLSKNSLYQKISFVSGGSPGGGKKR